MAKIRVVGRPRGGRCVFCHDALQGDVRTCPECAAAWHPECGAEATRARCPTIGCDGPAPEAEVRRGRRRRPAAAAREPEGHAAPAVGPRRRPGVFARFGPYVRLVISGALTALVLAGLVAFFVWPLVDPAGFWKFLSTGKRGAHVVWPLALLKGAMLLGVAGVFTWLTGRWLVRLPSVWRELGQLLDDTTPTAMHMTIYTRGSGKSKRRYARLVPIGRGRRDELTLDLGGLLPPWWLSWKDGQRVLVYGLPPPGPYIFEFEDGWLALVHPDD